MGILDRQLDGGTRIHSLEVVGYLGISVDGSWDFFRVTCLVLCPGTYITAMWFYIYFLVLVFTARVYLFLLLFCTICFATISDIVTGNWGWWVGLEVFALE